MDVTSFPLGKGYIVYPLEEIGQGRYGNVVYGEDRNGTPVAVKKLVYISKRQQLSNHHPDRIVTECMELLDTLSSKNNIIKYYDYSLVNEQHWLVMEYCDQGNLVQYFDKLRGSISPGLKVDITTQCVNGMVTMHERTPPLVHRQLTPQNILIRKVGNKDVVKISDFFLAKAFEGDDNLSTAYSNYSREDMNTYYDFEFYKAPEYFQTDGKMNGPSYDVFSMGLIMYGTMTEMFPPPIPGAENMRKPIGKGMADDRATHEISLTSQNDGTCDNLKNKVLEECINSMLQYPESKRPSANSVLSCIQGLGYQEQETILEEVDNSNSSLNVNDESHILQKFAGFLKIHGPTEYKDKKLREVFFQLSEEEMDLVLSHGSIKDYLLGDTHFKLVENKLVYVDIPADDSFRRNPKEETASENSEKMEMLYQKFTILLYKDPLLAKHLQYTDINTNECTIALFIDLQQNQDVHDQIKTLWEDVVGNSCNDIHLQVNEQKSIHLDWLINIEVCVGPGSIIYNDNNLEVMKSKITKQYEPMFSIKDMLISDATRKKQGWGTLGCFAVSDHPVPDSVYALSVKHLVNKDMNKPTGGIESGENVNMICGFEHTNEVKGSDPDFFHNKSLKSDVQDLVHISQEYQGFLGECPKEKDEPVGKFVDIGLYGPLPESVFTAHCKFNPIQEKHGIEVSNVLKQSMLVKKVGATTGFRRGIVFVDNYTIKSTAGTVLGNGAFLVTSYKGNEFNNDIDLDECGNFAQKGDSGSIILLDNKDSNTIIALGLVHAIMTEKFPFRGKYYNNVIVCVRLDYCLSALRVKNDWIESMKLYYYHFEPKLFLAQQELPEILVEAQQETEDRNENVFDVYQPIPSCDIDCLDVRKLASSNPTKQPK